MALTLALLNPLACIVHCLPRESGSAPLATAGRSFAFVCHVPRSTPHIPAETPRIDVSSTSSLPGAMPAPQAVYACVPVSLLLLHLIAVAPAPQLDGVGALAQIIERPHAPPPKAA